MVEELGHERYRNLFVLQVEMEVDDMIDQVRHDARIVLFATVHETRARSRETHEFGL